VLQGFDQATVQALLRMLLNVGKPAHEDERCYDKSGYDPLHHGCHSMGLATREDDGLHGRGRQCAARFAVHQGCHGRTSNGGIPELPAQVRVTPKADTPQF